MDDEVLHLNDRGLLTRNSPEFVAGLLPSVRLPAGAPGRSWKRQHDAQGNVMERTFTDPVAAADHAMRFWIGTEPGVIRIGSDAHKEPYCRMLLETHSRHKLGAFHAPARDDEALRRLTLLPSVLRQLGRLVPAQPAVVAQVAVRGRRCRGLYISHLGKNWKLRLASTTTAKHGMQTSRSRSAQTSIRPDSSSCAWRKIYGACRATILACCVRAALRDCSVRREPAARPQAGAGRTRSLPGERTAMNGRPDATACAWSVSADGGGSIGAAPPLPPARNVGAYSRRPATSGDGIAYVRSVRAGRPIPGASRGSLPPVAPARRLRDAGRPADAATAPPAGPPPADARVG